jgi:hypothetical protein
MGSAEPSAAEWGQRHVIRIQYADLPGGLHARAEARGRDTIVYLLPGLTVPQRRAALRRLRSSALVGHAPRLPGPGVTRAIVAARVRTNARNAVAALRMHPGILAPPIVVVALAAVAFVLLVPVPVGIARSAAGGPAKAFGGLPPGASEPLAGSGGGLAIGLRGGSPGGGSSRPAGGSSPAGRTAKPGHSPSPSGSSSPSASPSSAGPSASPAPGRGIINPFGSDPSPSPSPSPSPTPTPSPSPTATPDSLCIGLGLIGLCL